MADKKQLTVLLSCLSIVLSASLLLLQLQGILFLKLIQQQRYLYCGKMSEVEWWKNFRISKCDFKVLVDLIRPFYTERSSRIRNDVISLEKRIAVTLYYLKDQGSMTMTANTFGIARCTVGQVVHEICKILTENVGPQLIKFPVEREEVMESTAQFLKRFGCPQIIGCVDGTHVPIKQPSENAHDYMSYKLFYSINCQAICNAFGQFINVEIKWPGSVHTARVFANSEVHKGFTENRFPVYYRELIPGEECTSTFDRRPCLSSFTERDERIRTLLD